MTKEEFLEILGDDYAAKTLLLFANGKWSTCVITKLFTTMVEISDIETGEVRIISLNAIMEIGFPEGAAQAAAAPKNLLFEKAESRIRLESFEHIDHSEDIKQAFKDIGEMSALNTVKMALDNAVKNNCLEEKAGAVIMKLENLDDEFGVHKICSMLGEVHEGINEWSDAIREYANANDYHNAVSCALKFEQENSALLCLEDWLLDGAEDFEKVFCSFAFLCVKNKLAKYCCNVISDLIAREDYSGSFECIFLALVYIIDKYRLNNIPVEDAEPTLENISRLIEKIISHPVVNAEPEEPAEEAEDTASKAEESSPSVSPAANNIGYIIKIFPGYGFVSEKLGSKEGHYFKFTSVKDEKLLDALQKHALSKDLKVFLNLKVSYDLTSGPNNSLNAIEVAAAEDISHLSKSSAPAETEPVYETNVSVEEIERKLKSGSTPAQVVQHYSTTGRPMAALTALELSKNMFTYDKYVNNKIQLLQRTKSNDAELMRLLRYTINESGDPSVKVHHLVFLAQVQLRNSEYVDVITTVNEIKRMRYAISEKSMGQYYDAVLVQAQAHYLLKQFYKSDEIAEELISAKVHIVEATRLLDRTYAIEPTNTIEPISDSSAETAEFDEVIDADMPLTLFIDELIDKASISDILPESRFNEKDYTPADAKADLKQLTDKDKSREERNNPRTKIASAKILKWLISHSPETDQQKCEKELRGSVSNALVIIIRNELNKSSANLEMVRFYYMQRLKMSPSSDVSFNSYVMSYFVPIISKDKLRERRILMDAISNYDIPEDNLKQFIFGLLMLLNYADTIPDTQINSLYAAIKNSVHFEKYLSAAGAVLRSLGCTEIPSDFEQLMAMGVNAASDWLKEFSRRVNDAVNNIEYISERDIDSILNCVVDVLSLSYSENKFISTFVGDLLKTFTLIANEPQTSKREFSLTQCRTMIEKLQDDLVSSPTFISFTVFKNCIMRLGSYVSETLRDLTHDVTPNFTLDSPVRKVVINGEHRFLLDLSIKNATPSRRAENVRINNITISSENIEFRNTPTPYESVDENESLNRLLEFTVKGQPEKSEWIAFDLEYEYKTYSGVTEERIKETKPYSITLQFTDTESIPVLDNPYSAYSSRQCVKNSEMFFGRDQLIQRVYDSVCVHTDNGDVLRDGSGIVLYGQRRSGKTSILYHLKEKIRRQMKRAIIVDLGSLGSNITEGQFSEDVSEEEIQTRNENMTLQTMYNEIVTKIKHFITFSREPEMVALKNRINEAIAEGLFEYPRLSQNDVNVQAEFNTFINSFNRIAESDNPETGYRIVILMDEFNYLNTAIQEKRLPVGFMKIWKAFTSGFSFSIIIAGQDNMIEFIEQYVNEFNSFKNEIVTYLDDEAAFRLVTEPCIKDRITPDAARKLCRFTAGSAYLLMMICEKLVDYINKYHILCLNETLLDDFLINHYMVSVDDFKEDKFEAQYVDAGKLENTAANKQVLGLIARGSTSGSFSKITWTEIGKYAKVNNDSLVSKGISEEKMKDILERLQKREVIEKNIVNGSRNEYRIKIPLFKEWILRKGGVEY